MSWWSAIIEPVVSIIKEPLVEWQKRKTLKVEQVDKALQREHDLNLKKIDVNMELAKQGQKIEATWDSTAQKQMTASWKDEWFVLLFSIPLVLSFIPQYQDEVLEGFRVLSKTPDWYIYLVFGIVSATFGLRWMFGKLNLKR